MKVFLDTSAWLALEIKDDKNHEQAKIQAHNLKSRRDLLFTNILVLSETYTRLIYDVHLSAAKKFHKKIIEGAQKNLTLLDLSPQDRENTWKELLQYADHKLSFTDATIIVHFKEYRLDEIFTFDKHFRDINLPTNLK